MQLKPIVPGNFEEGKLDQEGMHHRQVEFHQLIIEYTCSWND